MISLKISYKKSDKWLDFDQVQIDILLANSVAHFVDLFEHGEYVVVAKIGEMYITNNADRAATYRSKGNKVKLFSDIEKSDRPLFELVLG